MDHVNKTVEYLKKALEQNEMLTEQACKEFESEKLVGEAIVAELSRQHDKEVERRVEAENELEKVNREIADMERFAC
jgi:hypothetical protein